MSYCDDDHEECILEIRRFCFPNLIKELKDKNLNIWSEYDKDERIAFSMRLGIQNILHRNKDLKESMIRHRMVSAIDEKGEEYHDVILYVRYV